MGGAGAGEGKTEEAGSGLYFIVLRWSRFALEMWANAAFYARRMGEPDLQSEPGGQEEWFFVLGVWFRLMVNGQ